MPTTELQSAPPRSQHQIRALLLVLFCTFLNAIAQVCFKKGAGSLGVHPSLVDAALGIITKPILFSGYALLGISTVLFILALRKGELSLLFPVFTLGYV